VYSPLEVIFTNLWGPSHLTSYVGFKYYISFIGAFSRYTWIFPIKTKVETISVFQAFKPMVELQLNTKIKSVQSDLGGSEYRPFSALLTFYDISHRLICPHTHHQMVWLKETQAYSWSGPYLVTSCILTLTVLGLSFY